MARTVINKLIIYGREKELEKFQIYAEEKNKDNIVINPLSLKKFIPLPIGHEDIGKLTEIQEDRFLHKYGTTDLSKWKLGNWGISHEIESTKIHADNSSLIYIFESEWNTPMLVFKKMSKIFPTLVFILTYTDFYLGISGKKRIHRGYDNIHLFEIMNQVYCPQCESDSYENIDGECFACGYSFDNEEDEE